MVRKKSRETRLNEILNQLDKLNVPMILAEDTVEAAKHAVENDLISMGSVDSIVLDAQEDLNV